MADFKYTVKRPNFPDTHFDDFDEASLYVEELRAKGAVYEWVDNRQPVVEQQKTKKPVVQKRHYCASCILGENKVVADVYVYGRVYNDKAERMMPYRAYLCNEHLDLLLDTQDSWQLESKKLWRLT